MRHATLAALVALLVVLAGCGTGPSSPTATDAPGPTATDTPTPTPSPTAGSGPDLDPTTIPGVRADGVNATRLTAAHDAALNRTAYTLNLSVRRGDTRQRIVVATEGPVPALLRREAGSRVREEYFAEGRFYRREVADGNVSYQVGTFVGNPAFTGAAVIREYMSAAQYEPAGTATRGDEPVVVLAADREDLRPNDVIPVDGTESFGSRVLVDADGVIRAFSFVATGTTAGGSPFVVRVELRVTGIGDTVVGSPDWLDEAREATSDDGTTTAGG